jgi:ubiquinone/menaquinone biosynthesis C-methylase UbiE
MNATAKTADITDVMRYWDARPCNIRHSKQAVGTKEYFDEVEARKYFVEPHIPGFAQFEKWSGKSVLEVGCGIGTDAVNFARNGARYQGVELSTQSMTIAEKRFEVFGLEGSFTRCNAEELSIVFPAANFDLVYSFGVIHHTPNQRAVIEEIRKVIRPDGVFKFMVYAKNSWKDAMIEAGLDQPEAQNGCPIATTYDDLMLAKLLEGAFEITEKRQAHIFPYRVEEYIKYNYVRQPWFEAMPPAMFDILERRFGWHLLVTARPI